MQTRLGGVKPQWLKFGDFDFLISWLFRLKCTKFNLGWGSAPDPDGSLQRAPRSADPLAEFKGPISSKVRKVREGREGMEGPLVIAYTPLMWNPG